MGGVDRRDDRGNAPLCNLQALAILSPVCFLLAPLLYKVKLLPCGSQNVVHSDFALCA